MARAHDGLIMLLMVGRNHTLRLDVFYDVWLYFTMVVISLLMDRCIMYGGWFHLFYCTCIMDSMRMMYLYSYICILF